MVSKSEEIQIWFFFYISGQPNAEYIRASTATELTLLLYSEVNDGGFCGGLRCVVWVGQFGGDVEAEVSVVLNLFVSKSNHVCTTCKCHMTKILHDYTALASTQDLHFTELSIHIN